MTYDEFVQEERQIEANHPEIFTPGGKRLSDYVLIVFNMRTGYKRHEWVNQDLDEDVKAEVMEFINRLEHADAE